MKREDIQEYLDCNGFEALTAVDGTKYYNEETVISIALTIPDVVKSLPTDECVHEWWAGGQDQKEGFWQEAPYRTNSDVVEEIKQALKYFIETWQR